MYEIEMLHNTTASSHHNCDSCPNISHASPNSSTTPTNNTDATVALLQKCIIDTANLTTMVNEIKDGQKTTTSFYRSAAKLGSVSVWVIVILMIIPLLQLIGCIAVIYYLGIQDTISPLINWLIGIVGIFSVIEVIVCITKLSGIEKRIERLEQQVQN